VEEDDAPAVEEYVPDAQFKQLLEEEALEVVE
jgi:hypothetical protein